jgi:REP element-mobilizing transposase RayT
MIRGIERRQIFRDDADREDFLSRLERLLPVTGISCFAWALIPNHAHFLFRTSNVPIATLMRRLLTDTTPSISITGIEEVVNSSRIAINPSSARKRPIYWNWCDIFI